MKKQLYVKEGNTILYKAESVVQGIAAAVLLVNALVAANYIEADKYLLAFRWIIYSLLPLLVICVTEADGRIRYDLYRKYGGYGFKGEKRTRF